MTHSEQVPDPKKKRSRFIRLRLSALVVAAAASIAGCWLPPGDVIPPPTPHLTASATTAPVREDVTLTATGAAAPPDGGAVMYTWLATGADGHQVRLDDSYSPTYVVHPANPGLYTFQVEISDSAGGYRPSNTVQVTFIVPTPHLTASATTAAVGQDVTLTATGAVKPGYGETVMYTWLGTGADGHQNRLDDTYSPTYVVHPANPGLYTFQVQISDSAGGYRPSNTVEVTVTAATVTPSS